MKEVVELFKWLLERDIRAKNATSCFVALLCVAVFFLASKSAEWFQDIERYGVLGVAIALVFVFFLAYLAAWLAWSGVAAYCHRVISIRNTHKERTLADQRTEQKAAQRERALRNSLMSLTDWQRSFLLRFLVEDRMQIPAIEVGQFRATWESEMIVLVEKGIVIRHRRADVYEIAPIYYDYLREHWNPQGGTLE